jgi:hypothetical protein
MSNRNEFSTRKSLFVGAVLLAQAFACSGGNDFTSTAKADGSVAEDSNDNANIVANPNDDASAHDAGVSTTDVDATAGLPTIDAAGLEGGSAEAADAGVTDAAGPDAPACSSIELACDGACMANDVHNCGGCGKPCATPSNGAAACNASMGSYACGVSCNTSYTHCAASCVDLQTDAKNCGSCGHDCIAGTCSAGTCQRWVVAKTSGNALSAWPNGPEEIRAQMASDGKYVVWIDPSQGILEVPIAGGAVKTLSPSTRLSSNIGGLAIAGGVVAWTVYDATNGTAVWTALEGDPGNSGKLTASAVDADSPDNLALDSTGTAAYFVSYPGTSSPQAFVYKCSLGTLGTKSCSAIQAVDTAKAGAPNDVIVFGSKIYWTDSANGSVWGVDYSQGGPAAVATGLTSAPYSLAADSAYLYWAGVDLTDPSDGVFTVDRAALASGATVLTVIPGSTTPLIGLAADGTNLYLDRSATLDYVPTASGGTMRTIPSAAPEAMTVAGGAIFWLDGDNNIYGLRFP